MKIVKHPEPEMISGGIACTINRMTAPVRKRPPAEPSPRSIDAIAGRLRRTREAFGLSQADLCRQTGLAPNTYNQWEMGKGRPEIDKAAVLCDTFGVTLDWIYLGNPACLPYAVAAKILH